LVGIIAVAAVSSALAIMLGAVLLNRRNRRELALEERVDREFAHIIRRLNRTVPHPLGF
jgi:hypothetical protein